MSRLQSLIENKTLFAVCAALGFFGALGIRSIEPRPERASDGLLVDLGNEVCPVMGGDVDGKNYIEWKRLRIGFCCPGCDRRFLAEPEDSLDTTAVDWRAALKAIDEYRTAPGPAALERLRKDWKVLREENS